MKLQRLTATVLAVVTLTAAPALAVQPPAAAPTERREGLASLDSFSSASLVEQLIEIGTLSDGRIGLRDPERLQERLEARVDRLVELDHADSGRSGLGFEINFTTIAPEPVACEDSSPVLVVSRQGLEIAGTLCRTATTFEGLETRVSDRWLHAPFDGGTIYINLVTRISAEADALRDTGAAILAEMAADVLRSLVFAVPDDAEITLDQWRGVLGTLTERGPDFFGFHAPDALAQALHEAGRRVPPGAAVDPADRGYTFGVNGAETVAETGGAGRDHAVPVSRPPVAAWCRGETRLSVTGPAGEVRTWSLCSGTPADEDADTLSLHKLWFEEMRSGTHRWLEFTLIGSTGTPADTGALTALCEEMLVLLARHTIFTPDAAGAP